MATELALPHHRGPPGARLRTAADLASLRRRTPPIAQPPRVDGGATVSW
jgi:hypothetical protein